MRRRLFAAACLGLCFAGLAHAAGQPDRNLLFIMDASGSMWGRVQNRPKIVIARGVMTRLVKALPKGTHAGLMAYGHRRKGDCGDIQTLVPVSALDRARLIKRLDGLSPKGKTPLAAAVKRAVKQLRGVKGGATIVLVSDGLESCHADPCAAVKAARKAGVDFKLDVVGFGLKKAGQLRCMAKAGGGHYYAAANGDELARALRRAVHLHGTIALGVTSGGKRLAADFTVYRAGSDRKVTSGSMGDTSGDNPAHIRLPGGKYDVVVSPNALKGSPSKRLTDIALAAGDTVRRHVDFATGTLKVRATSNGHGIGAYVNVYTAGTDKVAATGNMDKKPDDYLPNPHAFRLPAGTYDVKVKPKDLDASSHRVAGVQVRADKTVTRDVDFSVGTLKVSSTLDGDPAGAYVIVYKAGTDKAAASGNMGKKPHGFLPNPHVFHLPPGEYDIEVKPKTHKGHAAWAHDVKVTGGSTATRTIDMGGTAHASGGPGAG